MGGEPGPNAERTRRALLQFGSPCYAVAAKIAAQQTLQEDAPDEATGSDFHGRSGDQRRQRNGTATTARRAAATAIRSRAAAARRALCLGARPLALEWRPLCLVPR